MTESEQTPAGNLGEEPDHHTAGDAHAVRGFHYERVLRCLWLLELRGTRNHLSVADGEDAKLRREDGEIIYRQVKKREGRPWSYDKAFRGFVERAYLRYREDHAVRHEFYTNQAISTGPSGLRNQDYLSSSHDGVQNSAPDDIEAFCRSVRLFPERLSPDPEVLTHVLKGRLRALIESAYPHCQATNFVTESEINELVAKLLS